jgi:lysozyme
MDEELLDLIAQHECIGGRPNLTAYKDSVGIWTIGYGHNLEQKPIRAERAVEIFKDDVQDTINDCLHAFPWFADLTKRRQHAVVDMAFNLGMTRLKGFRNFLLAMELGDYETAAYHMLDSVWAKQVKRRSLDLAQMIRGSEAV